jgi:1-aminocyclopropane-1-carboxylate deaminase
VQISLKMLDFESIINIPTPLVQLREDLFEQKQVQVFVKRDDLTHPFISGNKFRKLKYNLLEAERLGMKKLLTFGGAYSNHLSAFAFSCKAFGFDGKVIVRGDELTEKSSPTLAFAASQGVELEFVTRTAYRNKEEITAKYSDEYFVIPEGGSNILALKGVREVIDEIGDFDYIMTACGTGGTMAGLIQKTDSEVIGIAALKGGDFLRDDISNLLANPFPDNATIFTQYHFGGYAKHTPELITFIRNFEAKHGILLEQVYTGKMVYAFYDLLNHDYFRPNSKVILLHTGGLQGRNHPRLYSEVR